MTSICCPRSNAGQSIPTHTRSYTSVSKYTFWGERDLAILLLYVNTRVAGVGVDDERPCSGEAVCVLVENDVTLVLDELF